ncbi:MAG: hypothetical protein R3C69_13410 [Geminicoccaceae bacterium]
MNEAALRVAGPRGADFVDLTGATIRNVARGVIGVAVLQALLVGVGLIVADVPHAGLLTLAVLVLDHPGRHSADRGPADHLVLADPRADSCPAVHALHGAGRHDRQPPEADGHGQGLATPVPVIFVGVLGGTIAYGLPGLFLGPMILALAYELVSFWLQDEPRPPDDA